MIAFDVHTRYRPARRAWYWEVRVANPCPLITNGTPNPFDRWLSITGLTPAPRFGTSTRRRDRAIARAKRRLRRRVERAAALETTEEAS